MSHRDATISVKKKDNIFSGLLTDIYKPVLHIESASGVWVLGKNSTSIVFKRRNQNCRGHERLDIKVEITFLVDCSRACVHSAKASSGCQCLP